jgi:hypothetical protein
MERGGNYRSRRVPAQEQLHQLLHMYLSMARIFQFGCDVGVIRCQVFGSFETENCLLGIRV